MCKSGALMVKLCAFRRVACTVVNQTNDGVKYGAVINRPPNGNMLHLVGIPEDALARRIALYACVEK
jgi:hypothetical protein